MNTADVIIVGGGPAGSSCARRLKQYDISCIVLDRAMFPREKLCAGWITPEVFDDLEASPSDYPYGIIALKKLYVTVRKIKCPIPTLQYSIRRYEFDAWLLRRAGVPVYHHTVKSIELRNEKYCIDDTYTGTYIVGAGGTNCPVYKTFFINHTTREEGNLIVTQEQEFRYPYTDPRCYLWFMENNLPGYAWYVPKENGYINIGVGGKSGILKVRNDTVKRHWELLVKKLDEKGLVKGYDFNPKGHSYYLRGETHKLRKDNAFLAGDAAGLATTDMGEGIGPAIRSGLLAAEAIARGSDYSLHTVSCRSLRWKWLRFGR